VIPFSRSPRPHQVTEIVGVESGIVFAAHGAAAGTADRESFYLGGWGQPLDLERDTGDARLRIEAEPGAHHRTLRSQQGDDQEENPIALCNSCHLSQHSRYWLR
jgi:hypothetical protein